MDPIKLIFALIGGWFLIRYLRSLNNQGPRRHTHAPPQYNYAPSQPYYDYPQRNCNIWGDSFIYRRKNGSWRAYFTGEPSSMHHVLSDNDGYYVCWDRPLWTEREARQVATMWVNTYGETL